MSLRPVFALVAALACLVGTATPALAHGSAPRGPRQVDTPVDGVPRCVPGGPPVVLAGTIVPEDESTYRLHPFEVVAGTTRVELSSTFGDGAPGGTPGGDTVVDLGLWDGDGTSGPAAFRGWAGSHHGVAHEGRPPVWVQADGAHRGFGGGAIEPGIWHTETGFGNVADDGGWYEVTVTCLDPETGPEPPPDPVDPGHVADPDPGWYHGDFHMHAYHSSPGGPLQAEVVDHAREVGLDFLPITEYVTTWHHATWGSTARDNPDLIVWPGREVITYDGHAIVLGETPGSVEYRDGFGQITMADIQAAAVADGALFGIAHPTIFPEPIGDLCRGCYADYLDRIDLGEVTTIEVLTGPVEYDASYLGGPAGGPAIEFPFLQTAVDLWEDLLLSGYRVTAVSGSDAKDAAGHGVNATAVYAEELSRPALREALRQQRAYVRTRGVADSPELELTASIGDETVMMGGTLHGDQATLHVTLRGAQGHTVDVIRNGITVALIPVPTDDFTVDVPVLRGPDGGPLGSFVRVDVRDPGGIRSIVSNPIWLAEAAAGDADEPGPVPVDDGVVDPTPSLPTTGAAGLLGPGAALLALAWSLRRPHKRRYVN